MYTLHNCHGHYDQCEVGLHGGKGLRHVIYNIDSFVKRKRCSVHKEIVLANEVL